MLNKIKDIGIRFSYCREAVYPQIPYTQDVLFVLQLSEQRDARGYYSPAGAGNWGEYIANVMLVSAVVASELLISMEPYDETKARKIIANAIVDLCPDEAKCLFVGAYADAKKLADEATPNVTEMSREECILACSCTNCKSRARRECLAAAAD